MPGAAPQHCSVSPATELGRKGWKENSRSHGAHDTKTSQSKQDGLGSISVSGTQEL